MKVYKMMLKQLGGESQLRAMIGASNFLYSSRDNYESDEKDSLEFDFKGSKKVNHFLMEYMEGKDLYKLVFAKKKTVNGLPELKIIKSFEMVHVAQVEGLFRDVTGLELKLSI